MVDVNLDPIVAVTPGPTRRTRFLGFARDYSRSYMAMFGLIVVVAVISLAVFAPWIAPQDPYDPMARTIMDVRKPPGTESFSGEYSFVLGTDDQGRDMFSAILYGLRISLVVGVGSALIAATFGTLLGIGAAYFGRRVDTILMRIVDLQLSIPAILVALMVLAILGRGVGNVVLAIILVEWAVYSRTARGSALVEKNREYIEAAEGLGLPKTRVILHHLLPNCLPPLIVVGTQQIARAISLEATLSFLGLGVPITEPSLGLLISNGFQYMMSGRYWISFFPGLVLLVTIVGFNLVGDHLREMFNPRLRK